MLGKVSDCPTEIVGPQRQRVGSYESSRRVSGPSTEKSHKRCDESGHGVTGGGTLPVQGHPPTVTPVEPLPLRREKKGPEDRGGRTPYYAVGGVLRVVLPSGVLPCTQLDTPSPMTVGTCGPPLLHPGVPTVGVSGPRTVRDLEKPLTPSQSLGSPDYGEPTETPRVETSVDRKGRIV